MILFFSFLWVVKLSSRQINKRGRDGRRQTKKQTDIQRKQTEITKNHTRKIQHFLAQGKNHLLMATTTESEFKGLRKWNPQTIGLTSTMGIFAPRGANKSFFIRDLIHKNQHRFPSIVVICPTENSPLLSQHLSPHHRLPRAQPGYTGCNWPAVRATNTMRLRKQLTSVDEDERGCLGADHHG